MGTGYANQAAALWLAKELTLLASEIEAQEQDDAMTRDPRIMFWDDERKIGNSLIVTLRYGWRFEDQAEHVRGFDTVREAMQAVRQSVHCDCDECTSNRMP